MVFQAFNLFPHMTVLDNITLAPRRVHGRPREAAAQGARDRWSGSGWPTERASYPDRLSGGQQQRVAIVRALVNTPVLMLLDEVTSALDPELVGEVLSLLRELKDEGMTMVVATHEMGFARQVADQVCFLSGGRILEHGPPEQIFDDPQQAATRDFPEQAAPGRWVELGQFGRLGADLECVGGGVAGQVQLAGELGADRVGAGGHGQLDRDRAEDAGGTSARPRTPPRPSASGVMNPIGRGGSGTQVSGAPAARKWTAQSSTSTSNSTGWLPRPTTPRASITWPGGGSP